MPAPASHPPKLEPGETYRTKSIQELLSLKGRVTVVTGGARGIGLALARGAAELGSDVTVVDVLDQPNEAFFDIERDLGVKVGYHRASVTDLDAMTRAFDAIARDFGRIDNCITAAGVVQDKPFLDTTWKEAARILDINVLGTYFSAQLAAKHMTSQNSGGSIVLIASVAAVAALPSQNLDIYGASKGAVKSLTRQLAVQLASRQIRVNSISPGYIATDLTKDLSLTHPELYEVFQSTAPIQRMGDRTDLKTIAGYLLSDAAAYTTGTDVLVTGGLHAGRT